jgi:hypothetical protein
MKHLSLFILMIVLTGLLAACAMSDFNAQINAGVIEQALTTKGLQICSKKDITGATAIGISSGTAYDLDTNCSQYDANKPGARVWVMQFANAKVRNAAFRRFMTENRRSLGAAYAWTAGPFVIAVDGNRTPEVNAAVKEAVLSVGGQ